MTIQDATNSQTTTTDSVGDTSLRIYYPARTRSPSPSRRLGSVLPWLSQWILPQRVDFETLNNLISAETGLVSGWVGGCHRRTSNGNESAPSQPF